MKSKRGSDDRGFVFTFCWWGGVCRLCVILILSAMLYDSLTRSRVKNTQLYEFTASPEVAIATHPDGAVLLYLDFDGVLHRRMNESFERMPLLEEILTQCPEILIVVSSSWRETMSLEG
jgi:hypothetical protein